MQKVIIDGIHEEIEGFLLSDYGNGYMEIETMDGVFIVPEIIVRFV